MNLNPLIECLKYWCISCVYALYMTSIQPNEGWILVLNLILKLAKKYKTKGKDESKQ